MGILRCVVWMCGWISQYVRIRDCSTGCGDKVEGLVVRKGAKRAGLVFSESLERGFGD